ncbi:MAG: DUF5597 domain-containing protein [Eubacterium sp.]|nr:DUF5597 domain-containing protein [Eubacterium sp.]
MANIPAIKNDNGIPTLYVKDTPFFALSGEIHNSSSSDLQYMETEIWPRLKGLHMNSVIVPLYWETIEPAEGEYHFELLDGLLEQARKNELKLIFLWFGLWKNGESMYVPAWMKLDTQTYYRARKANGEPVNTISPLCQAAIEKDAAAFAKIMAHIREMDEEESTVIIMQVENEIGLLGTGCDYSEPAREAFAQEVPKALAKAYGVSGTWKQAFGTDAEEYFMAYYFAKAVEQITVAGQKEYPLPCYTNAWLKQYPWYPGSYPSGGPVKNVHRIWKIAAPSLFTLAPDIYVPYVANILDEYGYDGNPLFVPEVRKDSVTASYCLYAFMHQNAIGYSPFGIEEVMLPPEAVDKPPMEVMAALNIDPSAFDITGSKDYIAAVYGLMEQMKPLYLKYRGTEHMKSYVKKSETDFGAWFQFGEYDLSVAYSPKMTAKPLAAGVVYELAANKFLIAGMMSTLSFRPKEGENLRVDYLKIEEGTLEKGEWKPGRILNGDERMALRLGDLPACFYVELYKY